VRGLNGVECAFHNRYNSSVLKENEIPSEPPLLMPSDVAAKQSDDATVLEPPSAKLIVRLFLIPALIVAAAVGVMFLIGRMAGSAPTFEEALNGLKSQGGERTADWLVGPGAKQRYLYAQTLTDQMKLGMSEQERIKTTDRLVELLDKYIRPEEGQVQNFVLLALGRVWQGFPPAEAGSPAEESQKKVAQTLVRFSSSDNLQARKAAILAMCFLAQSSEARTLEPVLIAKLLDTKEDLDVRMAAATALGPIASPTDTSVIDALHTAMNDSQPEHRELVWDSALSLAELNQPDVADTILMLLNRDELNKLTVLDRETDPNNPTFRPLNEQEKLRILINTMMGAKNLQVDAVQEKLKDLAKNDPSPRVRAAGVEILHAH
jgi:HEAT repeat protein